MFLRKSKSRLNKFLYPYDTLFYSWDKKIIVDDCIDKIILKKGDISITFVEDLREHIVNMCLTRRNQEICVVFFRKVILHENFLGADELKKELSYFENKNNIEQLEIRTYVDFLKVNQVV